MAALTAGGRRGSRVGPGRHLLSEAGLHCDLEPRTVQGHRGVGDFSQRLDAIGGRGERVDVQARVVPPAVLHQREPAEAGDTVVEGCDDAELRVIGEGDVWFTKRTAVAYLCRVGRQCRVKCGVHIIVMPESQQEKASDLADRIRTTLGEKLAKYRNNLDMIRDLLDGSLEVAHLSDEELEVAVEAAAAPTVTPEEQEEQIRDWDPVDLLVPEWRYLLKDFLGAREEDEKSGLTLSKRDRDHALQPEITRVLAVERLRKVNALVGFTRIDDMDRVGDLPRRLAPLTRTLRPAWTVATEDRGEGIFLQLDETGVAAWEERVLATSLWEAHRAAHERNFNRRFSETAANVKADSRLKPPRYWLIHTFAHVLIRELAITCGYSAASLSERLYAWPAAEGREPAAGLLICTTASDSDGTLGGLVQLSEPARLQFVVANALEKAARCSSDPVCSMRTPQDPEDFLHGAACHCCVMASETSCERANRFLERRFLIDLPGSDLGFFTLHE